ncbi:MAG: 3-phosphoserine/phosphohydroxythreonine transaminase [Spirochaetaceae bacterium]
MKRVFNFSAGPAMLPQEVLQEAASEMLDYQGSGMSVMEMSHRSKEFVAIYDNAEKLVREVMDVPDNYKVLFLQGGASTQFAMLPMNLMNKTGKVDVINTGAWTKKAVTEIKLVGEANVIASSEDATFSYIPKDLKFSDDADYVYLASNNTIYGTRFVELPNTGDTPIIADMSSNIMSEPINVSDYGVIFAGAQKNLGPAGVTLVIIRDDLIGKHIEGTPTMMQYKTHADAASMFNTPPTYGIYILGKVLGWIKSKGGLDGIYKNNLTKANLLYNYLDNSKMFSGTAKVEDRSLMNIPFVTGNDELDAKFIKEAASQDLMTLKGHRSVGGMRASIYNAMPLEGVEKLVKVMADFEKANS